MSGRTLSHYEIIAKLGEGGMGAVYKARDTRLNRFVAIKILTSGAVADEERRRRFTQEAQAASALNHPGIVTIHDIATDDGVDFIAMEFVEGETLEELIGGKGLPVKLVLDYGIQAAQALARAHATGIVHRDLKPSNIMVTPDGLVKILDFGVAKLLSPSDDTSTTSEPTRTVRVGDANPRTVEGKVIGTAAYMSPEQAAGQRVDARSDIFSFGAVLYEMATGMSPFASDSAVSTLTAVLGHDPVPPSQVTKHIPPELERIILRCLRKDPARRFQVISDVGVELGEVKVDTAAHAAVSPTATPRPYRNVWIAVAAAIVAALAVIAQMQFSSPEVTLPRPANVRVTSYQGDEHSPSLSADGNQVAFVWNGPNRDNLDVYVQPLLAERPLRLTTDPADDVSPAWSPDGSQIAFVRVRGQRASAIYVTPPLPDSERKLVDVTPMLSPTLGRMALAWSPDGRWIAIGELIGDRREVSVVSIDDTHKRSIVSTAVSPTLPAFYDFPAFSPDGGTLAYVSCNGVTSCVVDVVALGPNMTASGSPRTVTEQDSAMTGLAWTRDGRSIVYGSTAGAIGSYLWRTEVATGKSERIELGEGGTRPAIAPAADRLAYVRGGGQNADIWKFEGGSGPVTILSSTAHEADPQLSPDGTQVAFLTERSGRGREIWTAMLDGTRALRLTEPTGRPQGSPRWSPDGKTIAFDAVAQNGLYDVYVIDASGGRPRVLVDDPTSNNFPSWSRDGKWVYYRSRRSGASEVWRVPLAGGSPEQMTRAGGASAWESWDGETLYYTKSDGITSPPTGVFARSLAGGPERQVIDLIKGWDFYPVKDGIYYIVRADAQRRFSLELRYFVFATGQTQVLHRFESLTGNGLSASADGRIIIFSGMSPSGGSDLMLIQNFR